MVLYDSDTFVFHSSRFTQSITWTQLRTQTDSSSLIRLGLMLCDLMITGTLIH